MSPSAKRGLQLAKDLLRNYVLTAKQKSFATDQDAFAAIAWVDRQEAIDAKRRQQPRKLNPIGARMSRSRSIR